ncbi:MAG: hypothetical protein ABIY50_03345 [Ignavibacteria bacterium]
MKVLPLLLLSLILSSCSSSKSLDKVHIENPCFDSQFLKLKKMRVSEMTGVESEYFKSKTIECEEFEKRSKTDISTKDFIVVIGILGVVAGIFVFLINFKAH